MPKKTKTPTTEGDGAKPEKKSKKKLLAVLLVVVIAVGGFGYKTMTKKAVVAAKGATTTTVAGPITEESSLTVNLKDNHYLEFTAALQTMPGKSAAGLVTDQAIVLDILNNQAAKMTEAELLAPGGTATLKTNITAAIDHKWPGLIQAVYFEQFIMQ